MIMLQDPLAQAATRRDGFLPIGAYGVIGDGHTVALVGSDGAIDWMCLPEIDAPSVFGALLDPARGGRFVLAPAEPFTARRRYLDRTNVLETTFETSSGSVRVTEALTVDDALEAPWRELVRHVEGISGEVAMHWRLEPRFDYGQVTADFHRLDDAWVTRHRGLQIALQTWEAGEAAFAADALT